MINLPEFFKSVPLCDSKDNKCVLPSNAAMAQLSCKDTENEPKAWGKLQTFELKALEFQDLS